MAAKAFFNIRRVDGKINLKLKGSFDTDTIHWVTQVLTKRKFFHSKFLELDMTELQDTNTETMTLLDAALEKLKAQGVLIKMSRTSESKFTTAKGMRV